MMQLQRKSRWSVSSEGATTRRNRTKPGKERRPEYDRRKIRQWCAAATVEEAGERVVVVPDRDVAEVCRRLHDDAEEPMDFMRDLVAADGDGRLSVFYQWSRRGRAAA